MLVASRVTKTGGRDAATRHIPPRLALSVGKPAAPAPKGWQWSALVDLARLESGHTPSRKHPEYWGGDVPWISIGDARKHDGQRIDDTEEKTNELGIENSSARILPANTVCLSRTASVGYVVVMGRPMATSQDFVNWICSSQLDHNFLKYLFLAEDEGLLRFASGAVHQTIYFPEAKAFYICHPQMAEQQRIVRLLDEAMAGLAVAKANAEGNLRNARALFESQVQSVFSQRGGEWVEKALGDLCCAIEYGSSAKSKKHGKVPVLRMGNIREAKLDWENLVYSGDETEIQRYSLRHNDVLFNRTNSLELVGKTAVYKSEMPAIFAGYLIRIRGKEELLDPDYLNYFLNSRIALDYGKAVAISSVNQANISGTKLRSYPIPAPSLVTQREVVAQLSALATETQCLEGLHRQKLTALESLKKSLLDQAFRGEI